MGILRVLAGLVVAIGMTGAWIRLALAVMAVSLYIARLVPMTGRHRPQPRTRD
jgi:cytochrome c oxidase subunit IV